MINKSSFNNNRSRNNSNNTFKPSEKPDFSKISFSKNIDEELFGNIAETWAKKIAQAGKNDHLKNKYTQVRAFYDDIERLYRKSKKKSKLSEEDQKKSPKEQQELRKQARDKYFKADILPYVNMIKAKASYAESRKLVTENFTQFTKHCINQVNSVDSLEMCKSFYEAFMGFYRGLAPTSADKASAAADQ